MHPPAQYIIPMSYGTTVPARLPGHAIPLILLILCALIGPAPLAAQAPASGSTTANHQRIIQKLSPEFAELEERIFDTRSDTAAVIAAIDRALAEEIDADSQTRLIRSSSLLFLRGLVEINRLEDSDRARDTLEAAREQAEQLTEISPSAVSYRILGDIAAQEMLLYPNWQIIRRAPEVEKIAEQALEYDPDNPGAKNLIAYGRLNAPRLFGGDPEEARDLFREILAAHRAESGAPQLMRSQLFTAYIGLSQAMAKLDNEREARRYRQQAREIFPHHWELD